jgi:hypothetical protein
LGKPEVFAVLGLAAVAAALALVVLAFVFPHGSINNDEAIYRLQAQAIEHGHFFVPVVRPIDAFRPWLAAAVHNHWVLKYVPVEGGFLALVGAIAGTPTASLPVVAAALAVATWVLVREVLQDRWSAFVATALVVLSPLVFVQSAILVGYLPTIVLLEVFMWSAIRTVAAGAVAGARPSAWRCVLGGLAIGLAVVARPYDSALFATPVTVWALIRLRRQIVRPVGWYVVGALPPIVATLLYDWAATGSPLRLPFNLLEPADRPGFGPRRMFPEEPYHAFGLHSGIRGSASHLLLTILWVGGGPTLVLLALLGIWRRRRSAPALVLAAAAIAFPVGYVFFWGAWNASKLWHGVRFIGPFYFLPMVIPIAAFGGAELVALYRRWRPVAAVVVLVGLVSSVLVAAPAVAADARWSRQDGAVLAMVARHVAASPPALVLIQADQEYVMHPISGLANRWDGEGPLLYGLWSGTTQDLSVVASQPERHPYVLTLFGAFAPHPDRLAATLRPIHVKSGDAVTVHVAGAGGARRLTLTTSASVLGCRDSILGGWDVAIGASGTISCTPSGGLAGVAPTPLPLSPTGQWDGSLQLGSGPGIVGLTLPVRISDGRVTVLVVASPVEVVGTPPSGLLTAD